MKFTAQTARGSVCINNNALEMKNYFDLLVRLWWISHNDPLSSGMCMIKHCGGSNHCEREESHISKLFLKDWRRSSLKENDVNMGINFHYFSRKLGTKLHTIMSKPPLTKTVNVYRLVQIWKVFLYFSKWLYTYYILAW